MHLFNRISVLLYSFESGGILSPPSDEKEAIMTMPTYIMLMRWTQAGTERIKDDPQRIERLRDIFKYVGGEIKALYFTFGRYDKVVIAEAPSDEAMAKAVLTLGGFGTVQVETLKAFPEKDGLEIISELL
jgi:uncharacterized protein with GYD domain